MISHKKFKQLIGYREMKVNRNKSHKKKEITKTPLIISPVRRSMDKSADEIKLVPDVQIESNRHLRNGTVS